MKFSKLISLMVSLVVGVGSGLIGATSSQAADTFNASVTWPGFIEGFTGSPLISGYPSRLNAAPVVATFESSATYGMSSTMIKLPQSHPYAGVELKTWTGKLDSTGACKWDTGGTYTLLTVTADSVSSGNYPSWYCRIISDQRAETTQKFVSIEVYDADQASLVSVTNLTISVTAGFLAQSTANTEILELSSNPAGPTYSPANGNAKQIIDQVLLPTAPYKPSLSGFRPGEVTVNAQMNAFDGGGWADTVRITASPGGQSCTVVMNQPQSGPACTVTGLTNGTSYTFTATGINHDGTGPASVPSNSIKPVDAQMTVTWPGFDKDYSGNTPMPNTEPVTFTVESANGFSFRGVDFALDQLANPEIFPNLNSWIDSSMNSNGECISSGKLLYSIEVEGVSLSEFAGQYCGFFSKRTSSPSLDVYFEAGSLLSDLEKYKIIFPIGNLAQITSSKNVALYAAVHDWLGAFDPSFISPPLTPLAPTAIAGDKQATVTVSGAGASPATSFNVVSTPGGKSCQVTVPATSCVVTGLTNGTSYTFTAQAVNGDGSSGISVASNSVIPQGSAVSQPESSTQGGTVTTPSSGVTSKPVTSADLILNANVGELVAGSKVQISAKGLQDKAPYSLVVRSTPRTIASGNAVQGEIFSTATVPTSLEEGWHSLTFTSTAADATSVVKVTYFKVSSTGTLLATSKSLPAELALTGANTQNIAFYALFTLIFGMVLIARSSALHRRHGLTT